MHSTITAQTALEPLLSDPAFTSFSGDRGDFRLSGTVSVPIAA